MPQVTESGANGSDPGAIALKSKISGAIAVRRRRMDWRRGKCIRSRAGKLIFHFSSLNSHFSSKSRGAPNDK